MLCPLVLQAYLPYFCHVQKNMLFSLCKCIASSNQTLVYCTQCTTISTYLRSIVWGSISAAIFLCTNNNMWFSNYARFNYRKGLWVYYLKYLSRNNIKKHFVSIHIILLHCKICYYCHYGCLKSFIHVWWNFSANVSGEALIEFLRALNDSNRRITDWNDHFVSPCFSWSHVTCKNENVGSLLVFFPKKKSLSFCYFYQAQTQICIPITDMFPKFAIVL